jgi:hypothetical protein
MSLTLKLPPETEKRLHERAAQAGQSVEGVVLQLIEEALGINGGQVPIPTGQILDEILAPVRKGWEESGLSDDQVDRLFDDTLKKVRTEKRQREMVSVHFTLAMQEKNELTPFLCATTVCIWGRWRTVSRNAL